MSLVVFTISTYNFDSEFIILLKMTTILLGRICRTCLKQTANMRKLIEFIKDDLQIEGMLNQTIPNFDLEVDDIPLPVEICRECLKKLLTSYEFVEMCLKSNKNLKNILNQQEQEINLEATDILIDDFKTEPQYESSCASHGLADDDENTSFEIKKEDIKLEIEIQNENLSEENSSSEEYCSADDKDDSDSNSSEKCLNKSLDTKPKRKYDRKVVSSMQHVSAKTCPHCNKIFARKDSLIQHLSVHDSEHQFFCEICRYRFSSERKLKLHLSHKHKGVTTSVSGDLFPCSDCPMIFQKNQDLKSHRSMHPQKEFKCHMCDKCFQVENQLNDHINEHMGYKKYKCDFCEKSFSKKISLKDHVRVHTGESPYLCSHCGKSFKTASILSQHLQRHGEKKFHCPECPMKFHVKVNLTHHMISHSKLKPHVCDICGSAFSRQDYLKSHKFKHSGERPFKCEECNMSFASKYNVDRHKITHTGEKPHKCTFCDRAYAASGDLVKHLRTHVGEKTYFCDQCSKSFKYLSDLKDHKNLHYKEKLNLKQQINIG